MSRDEEKAKRRWWRPRFSIRAIAIVVTLVALSVWWVTWPERTAAKFVGLLNEYKFNEASRLMATDKDRRFLKVGEMMSTIADRPARGSGEVLPLDRSWVDVFFGRGCFGLGMDACYYVQRGYVSFDSYDEVH